MAATKVDFIRSPRLTREIMRIIATLAKNAEDAMGGLRIVFQSGNFADHFCPDSEYHRAMICGKDSARGCAIATISDTRTSETDRSGSIAAELLGQAGHEVLQQRIVTEELSTLRHLFREWTDDPRIHVVVGIGGTGLDSSDITPEALAPMVTKQMPGFGEIFRMLAYQEIGISALETSAMAAVCHSTLVYLVPAEPTAVKLACERLIIPQLGERLPTERLRPTMLPPVHGRGDSDGKILGLDTAPQSRR